MSKNNQSYQAINVYKEDLSIFKTHGNVIIVDIDDLKPIANRVSANLDSVFKGHHYFLIKNMESGNDMLFDAEAMPVVDKKSYEDAYLITKRRVEALLRSINNSNKYDLIVLKKVRK